MNTAQIARLGAKAKPTAAAVARWCEREGVAYEFLPARGGHPCVALTVNRQTRKVFFSGSPSAVGSSDAVIADCRRVARTLGWNPKKETEMTPVKSLADLPKLAEPPAPVIRQVEHIKRCPSPPDRFRRQILSGGIDDRELTAALKRRNEWIVEQKKAGRTSHEIHADVVTAGWHMKSPENIYAVVSTMRQRNGEAKPRVAKRRAETPKPGHEPEVVQHTSGIDPLVLAIAEALAPVIKAQLAKQGDTLKALKAKADKWDAISGLVREA